MFMPSHYADPVEEYWRLVTDVTMWDVACERQVEISGPDAAVFVQYMVPRDLSRCGVGHCRYVVITDDDGGIVNDAVLLRLAENHFWISPGDSDVLLWARGLAVGSGLQVQIQEPDVSPLQLQGPKSPQVAQALFGDRALKLGYYRFEELVLDGIPVVLARTGWSGEIGYELYLRDGSLGDRLWEMVMSAGKRHGIAPIGPSSIRTIEGGMLSYGADMTLADNPFEIGLERLVNLDLESEFVGKAALKRIAATGVRRRLVGLEIDGEPFPGLNEEPWAIGDGKQSLGRITRCLYSPRLRKNIGLANVPVELSAVGTTLSVETPTGTTGARVMPRPFVPASKEISG